MQKDAPFIIFSFLFVCSSHILDYTPAGKAAQFATIVSSHSVGRTLLLNRRFVESFNRHLI
jgi:hypothetical protein